MFNLSDELFAIASVTHCDLQEDLEYLLQLYAAVSIAAASKHYTDKSVYWEEHMLGFQLNVVAGVYNFLNRGKKPFPAVFMRCLEKEEVLPTFPGTLIRNTYDTGDDLIDSADNVVQSALADAEFCRSLEAETGVVCIKTPIGSNYNLALFREQIAGMIDSDIPEFDQCVIKNAMYLYAASLIYLDTDVIYIPEDSNLRKWFPDNYHSMFDSCLSIYSVLNEKPSMVNELIRIMDEQVYDVEGFVRGEVGANAITRISDETRRAEESEVFMKELFSLANPTKATKSTAFI